jgi:hypothetical protein
MNHEYDLQHLDIKPQNLFLVRNHIKVADFGLVKDLQGKMATVTGGITPVYAAPETFDGKVSRFCDQYSLGIVYEELLTGQRPFSGTSLQQLIMQHLSAPPNLTPLPKSDRGPIGRSLKKEPEGRFPCCMDLVQALREEAAQASVQALAPPAAEAPPPAAAPERPPAPAAPARPEVRPERPAPRPPPARPETPPARPDRTPRPDHPRPEIPGSDVLVGGEPEPPEQELVPVREAPPKQTGDGLLFPALLIGLGQKGLDVLRIVRESLLARFGSMHALPHIRLVYIDTDQDSIGSATRPLPGAPNSALSVADTLPVQLHRSAHYYRSVGAKLAVDWISAKWIHKIPRTPVTTGLRCLGRLGFVDHYRSIAARLRADLEACTRPEALATAGRHTQLGLRCNYPRVYLVTSLTGGTGSGMFIDLAYLVRNQLRLLGYNQPDVNSILMVPQLEGQRSNGMALGNAAAALTELLYFSAPNATFSARYDDRIKVKDRDPPFGRSVVLPLEPESDKSRSGT